MLSVIQKAVAKLVGTASTSDVLSGKTFYNTDAKTLLTGELGTQTKTATPSTSDTTIYNPVFNTAALDVLAPYLETGTDYIRLYVNEATTSVAITLSSYAKQEL